MLVAVRSGAVWFGISGAVVYGWVLFGKLMFGMVGFGILSTVGWIKVWHGVVS